MGMTITLTKRNNDIPLFIADVMAMAESIRIYYCRLEDDKAITFKFLSAKDRNAVARFIEREDYKRTVF